MFLERKTIIALILIFFSNLALGENESLTHIIERQSKNIQDLKKQISVLESDLRQLKSELKNAGIFANNSTLGNSDHNNLSNSAESINIESKAANTNPALGHENNFSKNDKDSEGKAEYDLALATLKNEDFESAEKQFTDFIASYPLSSLQSNANFWYAETFYRRSDFNKAAVNYLQTYKKFPKSAKAPDVLLRLAYSLSNLGKNKEACSVLQKLDHAFPERTDISVKRIYEAKMKFQCG